jgi:hypothetical protein
MKREKARLGIDEASQGSFRVSIRPLGGATLGPLGAETGTLSMPSKNDTTGHKERNVTPRRL